MHHADIKAALEKAGVTQVELAHRLGVTPMAIWQVIHGNSRSARIEREIADVIGLPLSTVWPAFYKDQEAA